jgi:hypothetical protein
MAERVEGEERETGDWVTDAVRGAVWERRDGRVEQRVESD